MPRRQAVSATKPPIAAAESVNSPARADNLLPDDVADIAGGLGYPIDRRNVTRALEAHLIAGVAPPPRRGVPWTIPRAAFVDVLAACLERRALRGLAPHGGRPRPFHAYRVAAAERVLAHPELRRLVPRHLALEVGRIRRARAERQRQEEERRAEMLRRVEENSPMARWRREQERRRRED